MTPTQGQNGENPAYRSSWPRHLSHDRNAGQPPCWSVSLTERSAPRLSQPWNPVSDRRVSAVDHCSRSPSLGTAALTAPWSSPWNGRRSVPPSSGRVILTLLSLARAATSVIFVATNVLSRQTRLLWRQKYACSDKTSFVVTKVCLSRHNFSRDRRVFVGHEFCRGNHHFVAIKDVYQNDKMSRPKTFVATEMILVAVPADDTLPLSHNNITV